MSMTKKKMDSFDVRASTELVKEVVETVDMQVLEKVSNNNLPIRKTGHFKLVSPYVKIKCLTFCG